MSESTPLQLIRRYICTPEPEAGVSVVFASAKAALTALGTSPAEEFGPRGGCVNTFSPELVRTSVNQGSAGQVNQCAAVSGLSPGELVQQNRLNPKHAPRITRTGWEGAERMANHDRAARSC